MNDTKPASNDTTKPWRTLGLLIFRAAPLLSLLLAASLVMVLNTSADVLTLDERLFLAKGFIGLLGMFLTFVLGVLRKSLDNSEQAIDACTTWRKAYYDAADRADRSEARIRREREERALGKRLNEPPQ